MADGHEENRYLPIRAAGGSSVNEFCEERLNVHIADFLWSPAIPCSTYVYTTVQSRNQIKLSLRPLFEGPPLTLTTFIFIYLLFIFYFFAFLFYGI